MQLVAEVIKVAMVHAIARNPAVPEIEHADLDLGEAVVKASCLFVEELARDHIADNATERDVQIVIDFVRARGGSATKNEIARGLRSLKAKERQSILDDLVNEQNVLELHVDKSATGRPTVTYKLVGS
jgi:hypothetical protein